MGRIVRTCVPVAVAMGLLLAEPTQAQDPQPREPQTESVSIVLLEAKARAADEKPTLAAAKRAFGVKRFESEDNLVLGQSPIVLVKIDGFLISLTFRDGPAVPDPKKGAEEFEDPRMRQAFANHVALLHCAVRVPDGRKRAEATTYLSRLVAEIADESTLAISFSDVRDLFPVQDLATPELRKALRAGKPIDAIRTALAPPTLKLDAADKKAMAEAVATAQTTWPQFLELFRAEGTSFPAARVTIKDGQTSEVVWIRIESADDAGGVGRISGSPQNLPDLKHGDRVTFRMTDLADWVCYIGTRRQGGFTIKVFEDAQRKAAKKTRPASGKSGG